MIGSLVLRHNGNTTEIKDGDTLVISRVEGKIWFERLGQMLSMEGAGEDGKLSFGGPITVPGAVAIAKLATLGTCRRAHMTTEDGATTRYRLIDSTTGDPMTSIRSAPFAT